jgi:molybdopterin converting factor small subunit
VLVNGVYIDPSDRAQRVLQSGEVLAIWPPVAGG